MVGLLNEGDPASGTFCGGALINASTVVTAAHCFTYHDSEQPLYVATGRLNLVDDHTECSRTIKVGEVHKHEGYERSSNINDIAILKLDQPASCVKPNDLVRIDSKDGTDSHAGELATVMGWGARDAERRFDSPNTPDALHGVELAVGTHKYCSDAWANRGKSLVFNQKNLCARGEGVDACNGDSGGPLVIKGGKQDVLIGVVSWGNVYTLMSYPQRRQGMDPTCNNLFDNPFRKSRCECPDLRDTRMSWFARFILLCESCGEIC